MMNNFKLIQEHFTQLHCPSCDTYFTQESVNLIREEKDYWIVKVNCNHCNHSPGFAIVGIEYEEVESLDEFLETNKKIKKYDTTFSEKPPITVDDVLDAHRFIKNLGSDWNKYISTNDI